MSNKEMVNHPDHYNHGEIETIEIIEFLTRDLEGTQAFALGNLVKYVHRCNFKNGWEDIKKAKWYLDLLLNRKDDENV